MADPGGSVPDWFTLPDLAEEWRQDLPLFPLNVVLFPRMPLPLQIFEPRYLEMIDRCMAEDRRFGVCLIQDGVEAYGPAEVWPVGTIAHIEHVERLDDGRLAVITRGMERFRVLERLPDRPFPRARVSILDDESEAQVDNEVVRNTQDLLLRYLRGMARKMSQDWGDLTMPEDAALLGYIVGAVLPCSLSEKQRFLQAGSAAERLLQEIPMLRREVDRLESDHPVKLEPETTHVRLAMPFQPDLRISSN